MTLLSRFTTLLTCKFEIFRRYSPVKRLQNSEFDNSPLRGFGSKKSCSAAPKKICFPDDL
jgi:hypothetical protein